MTISQYKMRKVSLYRAGRITACTLKSVCSTDVISPAITTVERICYSPKAVFNSKMTSWGSEHEKDKKTVFDYTKKIPPFYKHHPVVCF